MANDLTVLKGTVTDRANALGSYLGELRADLGRDEQSFRDALDMCVAYTRAFVKQLDEDWNQADGRGQYQMLLRSSLESFLKREHWIDKRFARSRQGGVPRALKSIARRHFQLLEIAGHEPVLTVGPPDSFEAQLASLSEFLFDDCYIRLEAKDEDLRSRDPNLSVFCAPYIEGTRVLWYPIVVGHEIAHIRLERGPQRGEREGLVEAWLSRRDVSYGALLDEIAGEEGDPALIRVGLNQQALNWATELICDLNAVRLFGPAGLSAIAEFLSILESQEKSGRLDPYSHPPVSTRLGILFRYLSQLGWDDAFLPEFARVWKARYRDPVEGELDKRSAFIANLVAEDDHAQGLIDFVKQWHGEAYTADNHLKAIEAVADELIDGVPGATHLPRAGQVSWPRITVADVVNGTWAARQLLDEKESGNGGDRAGTLIDSDLEAHDKRLRLDSLASKAIDTLELARLWGDEHGVIAPPEIRVGPTVSSDAVAGGVLSRAAIANLLTDVEPDNADRIVVTPLFEDSIQDAAIDLRLGPDFIVFRHSSTTAFDPLAKGGQDPRTMQERVHKNWGERFILHPGELVLASTLEYVALPGNVAAQVLTRSSYGRLGLLTATAVQVQPGSRGCITLELVNHGETPIALSPAARIAQLMLWFVPESCEAAPGKYVFPVGPQFSKVADDVDGDALRALRTTANRAVESSKLIYRLRVEAPRQHAERFLDVARAFGAKDVPEPEATPSQSRPRQPAAVTLELTDRQLGTAVEKWHQGDGWGVRLEIGDEIVVRLDRDLARGQVIVSDERGERVEALAMPPDTAADLSRLVRFWKS